MARHSLRLRNTLARNNFGSETTSAQRILRPGEYFSPENTLARCILWPGDTSAQNNFGPETTLALDQTFKSVIFHHFWHSIGLLMPQGEIKAIITNITKSDKELEILPGKAQNSKSSKQNWYYDKFYPYLPGIF